MILNDQQKQTFQIYSINNLDFCNSLTNEVRSDFNKDVVIAHSKYVLSFIVSAINYDVLTIKLVNTFTNFIITVYSDKAEIFTNYLLQDVEMFKNFTFIINHIFNPEDYFVFRNFNKKKQPKDKVNQDENLDFLQSLYLTEDLVVKKIREKYDINKYSIKDREDFDIHSHKINNLMFRDAISQFIQNDEEMKVFLDKYLEDQLIKTKDFPSKYF